MKKNKTKSLLACAVLASVLAGGNVQAAANHNAVISPASLERGQSVVFSNITSGVVTGPVVWDVVLNDGKTVTVFSQKGLQSFQIHVQRDEEWCPDFRPKYNGGGNKRVLSEFQGYFKYDSSQWVRDTFTIQEAMVFGKDLGVPTFDQIKDGGTFGLTPEQRKADNGKYGINEYSLKTSLHNDFFYEDYVLQQINEEGNVYTNFASTQTTMARPYMNLNSDYVLFASVKDGGKGTVDVGGLAVLPEVTNTSALELTMDDAFLAGKTGTARQTGDVQLTKLNLDGAVLNVDYEGGLYQDDKSYLSYFVGEGDAALDFFAYGKGTIIDKSGSGNSGNINLAPVKDNALNGKGMALTFFNEYGNGTSWAGQFAELPGSLTFGTDGNLIYTAGIADIGLAVDIGENNILKVSDTSYEGTVPPAPLITGRGTVQVDGDLTFSGANKVFQGTMEALNGHTLTLAKNELYNYNELYISVKGKVKLEQDTIFKGTKLAGEVSSDTGKKLILGKDLQVAGDLKIADLDGTDTSGTHTLDMRSTEVAAGAARAASYNTLTIGTLWSDANLAIDVGKVNDAFTSDKIILNGVDSDAKITLNAINLIDDPNLTPDGVTSKTIAGVAAGTAKDSVVGGFSVYTASSIYTVSLDGSGNLTLAYADVNSGGFKKFIESANTASYSFVGDTTLDGALTTGNGSGSNITKTVFFNNHKLQGSSTDGITVADTHTMTMKGGTVTGFATALNVASSGTLTSGGTLNLQDMTITGNTTADVANAGTMNIGGNVTIGTLTGSGTTDIGMGAKLDLGSVSSQTLTQIFTGDGTLNFVGDATIAVKNLGTATNTVAKDKTLTFTNAVGADAAEKTTLTKAVGGAGKIGINDGTEIITDANNLQVAEVANAGILKIQPTEENENKINSLKPNITGEGSLELQGFNETHGTITQNKVTIAQGSTLDAYKTVTADNITNNGAAFFFVKDLQGDVTNVLPTDQDDATFTAPGDRPLLNGLVALYTDNENRTLEKTITDGYIGIMGEVIADVEKLKGEVYIAGGHTLTLQGGASGSAANITQLIQGAESKMTGHGNGSLVTDGYFTADLDKVQVPLENRGEMTLNQGASTPSPITDMSKMTSIINSGTLNIGEGITLNGTINNSGTMTVELNSPISGDAINSGTMNLKTNLSGNTLLNTGTVNMEDTAHFENGARIVGGTVNVNNDLEARTENLLVETINIADSKTLKIAGAPAVVDGFYDVFQSAVNGEQGTLEFTEGSLYALSAINSKIVLDDNVNLNIDADNIQKDVEIGNNANLNLGDGQLKAGSISNNNGTVNFKGTNVLNSKITGGGTFNNNGLLTVADLSNLDTSVTELHNTGTVNIGNDTEQTLNTEIDGGYIGIMGEVIASVDNLNGDTYIAGGHTLTVQGGADVSSRKNVLKTIQGADEKLPGYGNGSLVTEGVLKATLDNILMPLENKGDMQLNNGSTNHNMDKMTSIINSGTLNIGDGITLNKDITNSGTVTMTSDSVFESSGKIEGGKVSLADGVNFKASNLVNIAELAVNNAIYNFNANLAGTPSVDIIDAEKVTGTLHLGTVTLSAVASEDEWGLDKAKEVRFLKDTTSHTVVVGNTTAAFDSDCKYTFGQAKNGDSDKIGFLSISKTKGAELWQIIRGKTVDGYDTSGIGSYSLTKDYYEQLKDVGTEDPTTALGTLQKSAGATDREFTINGNGFAFDGNGKKGITVDTGGVLNFLNIKNITGWADYVVSNSGTVNFLGENVLNSKVSKVSEVSGDGTVTNAGILTVPNVENLAFTTLSNTNSMVLIGDTTERELKTIIDGGIVAVKGKIKANIDKLAVTEIVVDADADDDATTMNSLKITGSAGNKLENMAVQNYGIFEVNIPLGNIDIKNVGTLNLNDGVTTSDATIIGGKVNIGGNMTTTKSIVADEINIGEKNLTISDADGVGILLGKLTATTGKVIVTDSANINPQLTAMGSINSNIELGDNTILNIAADNIKKSVEIGKNANLNLGDGQLRAGSITNNNGTVNFLGDIKVDTGVILPKANFANGSILTLDVSGGDVPLTVTDSITVAEGAKLYLTGATKNANAEVLEGTAITDDFTGWELGNIRGEDGDGNLLKSNGYEIADNKYFVLFKSLVPETTDLSKVLQNAKGTPLMDWAEQVSDVCDMAYGDAGEKYAAGAMNSMANMNALANVQQGTQMVTAMATDAIQSNIGAGARPILGDRGQVSGNRYQGSGVRNVAANAKDSAAIEVVETGKADEVMPSAVVTEKQKYDKTVWANFIHSKKTISGLETGSLEQNSTIQFNGVTVGADLWSHYRGFGGLALTTAEGKIHSGQSGASVKNETDYQGVSLYNRYDYKGLAFLMDLTYTHAKNDVTMSAAVGADVTAKPEADAYSAGLKIEKPVKIGHSTQLTPYTGARYTHIHTDDYENSVGINNDIKDQDIVSVPVGLQLKSEMETERGWKFGHILEGGYVWNFGDRQSEQRLGYQGIYDSIDFDVTGRGEYFLKTALTASHKDTDFELGYRFTRGDNEKDNKWNFNVNYNFGNSKGLPYKSVLLGKIDLLENTNKALRAELADVKAENVQLKAENAAIKEQIDAQVAQLLAMIEELKNR